MTIISSWSMCWLISKELGYDSKNIVVIKNENKYLKPVTNDIICFTKKPSKEEIAVLKEKIDKKGSASIKIKSKIIEDNNICVEFEGTYIIKL
jgi:thioesterase domain-containing protein